MPERSAAMTAATAITAVTAVTALTGVPQKPNEHGDMLLSTYRPRKGTSLLQRDLMDGCVLHDRESGLVYTLNSSASFILTFCTGDYPLGQIAVETATAFGLQAEDALRDVISTVRTLLDEGLLDQGSLDEDPGICDDGPGSFGGGNGQNLL
ncbi:MAG: hypothetical protein C0402_14260 [Thermodesulfovibrio sp.]|nr:hypothetical protein [Thermodesulfovibrio sp.]